MERQIGPPGDGVRGEVEGERVATPEAQHLLGRVTGSDALLHERGRVVFGHWADFDLVGELAPFPGTPCGVGWCAGDDDGGRQGRQCRHEVVADPVVDQPQPFVAVDDEQRDVALLHRIAQFAGGHGRVIDRRTRHLEERGRGGLDPSCVESDRRPAGCGDHGIDEHALSDPGGSVYEHDSRTPRSQQGFETATLTLTPDTELHPRPRQPVHHSQHLATLGHG